jgi:5-methylcytosine-specific restriction endonuclease McrA
MPFAAPRVCSCGSVVASGVTCACQRKRHQEAKARSDARRPSATARGYDSEWRRAAKAYLAVNPRCAHPGCTAFATVVDHRVPHRGDKRLFWDRSNWQGLCAHHHNSAKQRMERQ